MGKRSFGWAYNRKPKFNIMLGEIGARAIATGYSKDFLIDLIAMLTARRIGARRAGSPNLDEGEIIKEVAVLADELRRLRGESRFDLDGYYRSMIGGNDNG